MQINSLNIFERNIHPSLFFLKITKQFNAQNLILIA